MTDPTVAAPKPSLPADDSRPDQRRDYVTADADRPDPAGDYPFAMDRTIIVRVRPNGPGPADWEIIVDPIGIDPWSAQAILEAAVDFVHLLGCPHHRDDEEDDDEYDE